MIHDPTELKTSTKNPNPLVQNQQCLQSFKVFTIRETVQKYLMDNFKISSEFKIFIHFTDPCEKLDVSFML